MPFSIRDIKASASAGSSKAFKGIRGNSSSDNTKEHASRLPSLAQGVARLLRKGPGKGDNTPPAPSDSWEGTDSLLRGNDQVSSITNALEGLEVIDGQVPSASGSMDSIMSMPLLSPTRDGVEVEDDAGIPIRTITTPPMPNVAELAIDIHSGVNMLERVSRQEFWVAIEIGGRLNSHEQQRESNIDVVIVLDNGYYVSEACFSRARGAALRALKQLRLGDRVALFTTHCTHANNATKEPDLLVPLYYMCSDTEKIFRTHIEATKRFGTQGFNSSRPIPTMPNTISAIMQYLRRNEPGLRTCHFILLSPKLDDLHSVSIEHPEIHLYYVNPASLPNTRGNGRLVQVCNKNCCKNVLISNWLHFQSLTERIHQIIRYARSNEAQGYIQDVVVNVSPSKGCEILEYHGSPFITSLRPGEVHILLFHLRVSPSRVQKARLDLGGRFYSTSLDVTGWREKLKNVWEMGGEMAHLLKIEASYRNSLFHPGTWTVTEVPFFVHRDLGRMECPRSDSMGLHQRYLFDIIRNMKKETALIKLRELAATCTAEDVCFRQLLQNMENEVLWQQKVAEYELQYRSHLPASIGRLRLANCSYYEHVEAVHSA